MAQIAIECLKAVKNYTGLMFGPGSGRPMLLSVLTVIAWFVLFFKEKDKNTRIPFVHLPIIIMVVFICPLTLYGYTKAGLDKDTYYRILWIIPMGVISVYAIVKLFEKNVRTRIVGAVLGIALIVLTGRCIYTSESFMRSENIYGIPQNTVDVVEFIKSVDDHEDFTVLPTSDLITTIRQYDAGIRMPYGRDMFNPALNYTHPVFEVYERAPKLDFKKLLEVSRDYEVEYIIVYVARQLENSPEDAGLEYVGRVKDYLVYRDPVMADVMSSIDQYYPDKEN